MSEDRWKMMQRHLGYNDEEMKIFRADPRNQERGSRKKSSINIKEEKYGK